MDKRLRHISLLRCFEAAARHQSYSLAAHELSITQAAVSQQIRNLEQHLEVKLFVREGRRMLLTQRGKTLLEYVAKAFDLVSRGFDRIQVEPEEGVLKVTASFSFASIWLVPRLWKFAELYPDVSVKVLVTAELEDLRHSELDVAIRQGDLVQTEVHQEVLFVDPVFPVCSPKLIAETKLDSPEQISCCQLIEVQGPGRYSWQNWFDAAGATFREEQLSWIEVYTSEMGINSVMAGQGICLASSIVAQGMIEKGLLVKPFKAQIEPGLRFSLLYDEESPRMARIKVFSDWLKEELKLSGMR
jgi:LysR family glycine cleavage system transcriptional activator